MLIYYCMVSLITDPRLEQLVEQIKSVQIQGATNIALRSLDMVIGLADAIDSSQQLEVISRRLALARNNEPLTRNLLSLLVENQRIGFDRAVLKKQAQEYKALIKNNKKLIADNLANLIRDGKVYLSHCHSTSLTAGLIAAKKQGKKFKIIQTETRPLFQGRITAKNLITNGIDTTLIVDSAAAWLISDYDDLYNISMVFVGADAITTDGWLVNKVGTFANAASAFLASVPVYVVASLLKISFKPGRQLKVEVREEDEIWPDKPSALKVLNLAFDKTPVKFLTGFVTEVGIIRPDKIHARALEVYPNLSNIFV